MAEHRKNKNYLKDMESTYGKLFNDERIKAHHLTMINTIVCES